MRARHRDAPALRWHPSLKVDQRHADTELRHRPQTCNATISLPVSPIDVYGGRFDAKKGSVISAYGQAQGSVDGPRTVRRSPDVDLALVIESCRANREGVVVYVI